MMRGAIHSVRATRVNERGSKENIWDSLAGLMEAGTKVNIKINAIVLVVSIDLCQRREKASRSTRGRMIFNTC